MAIATHTPITTIASVDRPNAMLPHSSSKVFSRGPISWHPKRKPTAFHILVSSSAIADLQAGADLFDSIKAQSFGSWRLSLLAENREGITALALVRHYASADSRVSPVALSHEMLREHLQTLDEDVFVVLIDRPGRLAHTSLMHFCESIERDRKLVLLYGDETGPVETGQAPSLIAKPAFDREMIHDGLVGGVVAASAAAAAAAYVGRPDHRTLRESLLRIMACPQEVGLTSAQIAHVPGVAFHRLVSTKRATSETVRQRKGFQSTVTVIIPTRDRADLLRMTIDGLLRKTDYPHIEVIIVDNGSVEHETLALMSSLDPASTRVLRRDEPFNFARLNNDAARHAKGDILLFLNNDIEVLDPAWMHALVTAVEKPGVGAAGALLLYPDHTIQHAGVVLGANGAVAAHVGAHEREEWLTQTFGTGERRVSALTAACMAVPRRVFHEMGGFDERLAVAYNDVDFCLRLGAAGYRCVFTPEARLIHHESATRASDTAPENRERAFQEERLMRELWGTWLFDDPFFPQAYGLSPLETVSDGTPRRSPILAKLT